MKKYIFQLNYNEEESQMAYMEIKYLFNELLNGKYFFSDLNVEATRSVFIKYRLEILFSTNTIDELLALLDEASLTFNRYKVIYVQNSWKEFDFHKGLELSKKIGYAILGDFEMKKPDIYLGITYLENKWYFGIVDMNDQSWHMHDDKPQNFSNSLPIRVAKSLVNIAAGNNLDTKLVDPCCGVGTVLMEACRLKIPIDGYDISYLTCQNARENMAYYNYACSIKRSDIKDIKKHYDVAIVDLPYGLFTAITKEEQMSILHNAYRISDKLVLVTNVDMKDELKLVGYQNIDESYVIKAKFKRYIFVAMKA